MSETMRTYHQCEKCGQPRTSRKCETCDYAAAALREACEIIKRYMERAGGMDHTSSCSPRHCHCVVGVARAFLKQHGGTK